MAADPALEADWLGFCRRSAESARELLSGFPRGGDRTRYVGRGEGGDMTLEIDRGVEDAVFRELEALGAPVTAVSEERGHVAIAGGGPVHVVIDPIDGSLNAKRHIPAHALSIAVAGGPSMGDVELGYVAGLASGEEFHAQRGQGAWLDGERLAPAAADAALEVLGVESAHPWLISAYADAIAASEAHRVRMVGSIALTLCFVASARFDAMFSLRPCRSVDAAAAQLIVREAGGSVAFPDVANDLSGVPLDLGMRSRVAAAGTAGLLDRVLPLLEAVSPSGERPR